MAVEVHYVGQGQMSVKPFSFVIVFRIYRLGEQ